jgi:hypothetical protein
MNIIKNKLTYSTIWLKTSGDRACSSHGYRHVFPACASGNNRFVSSRQTRCKFQPVKCITPFFILIPHSQKKETLDFPFRICAQISFHCSSEIELSDGGNLLDLVTYSKIRNGSFVFTRTASVTISPRSTSGFSSRRR